MYEIYAGIMKRSYQLKDLLLKKGYCDEFGFAHFWSVTLVSTNKTTLFTPPSVISYI
jgi:hypothetical protein